MTEYDPQIIQKFADRLYGRARTIIALYGVLGLAIGAGASLMVPSLAGVGANVGAAVVLAAIGGVIGYLFGEERALSLQLQAQIALCQLRIEQNSRTRS